MTITTQDEQRPARPPRRGRPLAFLIAGLIGLGGLGAAVGMTLGSVGSASPAATPKPASADYDCPGRGGFDGP